MTLVASLFLTAALSMGDVTAAQIHAGVYPAPTAPLSTADLPGKTAIDQVRTADGVMLKGIEIPPAAGKPTLLVFHGNESSAMETVRWFAPLLAEGYGIVAAEYRGYSGNPGNAGEAGLAADADAFYWRARTLAGTGRLIVVGHSLGGGVAFGLARRERLDALVTIGTFTSLAAMLPAEARTLTPDRYDNRAAVADLDEPYYEIHGTADDTVPYAQGQELARAATAAHKTGAAFSIEGAGHAPGGMALAMILRAIAAKLDNGATTVKVTLPLNVKVIPF
jgi:fermentation-respiration switch protein FrsA (DUF1100 family)